MRYLLLALLLSSCVPKTPTTTDVATTAVVLTDDALAVAIAVQPKGADFTVWEDRVAWLEQAADAVRNSQSLCPHVGKLRSVAEGIGCTKCTAAIETARKAIPCP
jgi:hypothetical protein